MPLLKTVFLLDRSPYIVNTVAKTFEVEVFKADEGADQRFFQIPRTIWSCAVEAVLEYRRIVRDLFVETSHLCFVASGRPCRAIGETWSEELDQAQVLLHGTDSKDLCERFLSLQLLQQIAILSKRDPGSSDVGQFGDALSTVTNILCTASPQQLECMNRGETDSNDCRLVAITHIEKLLNADLLQTPGTSICRKEDLLAFFQRVRDEVNSKNAQISSDSVSKCVCLFCFVIFIGYFSSNLPIGSLTVCLINVSSEKGPDAEFTSIKGVQMDAPFEVKPTTKTQYVRRADLSDSPFVFELYNPCSMEQLLANIYLLVQKHHQLGSTTVCNIPMKEEQQFPGGKSSKTYDVELVHPLEAFIDLWMWGLADDEVFRERHPSTASYKTLRLYWGSPLVKPNIEFQNLTTRVVRCTPVQLNSRESICLTSFILGGRSISLELQVPQQGRRVTHIMQCHGKVIYMHSVSLGASNVSQLLPLHRNVVRANNSYRVDDFANFCKTATLTPAGSHSAESCSKDNGTLIERQTELKRRTNFWPLTFNESSIFANYKFFEPIISIAKTGDLTNKQLMDCHKVVSLLNSCYEKKEASQWIQCPSWMSLSTEEQYNKTWSDLQQYTLNYAQVSKNHAKLHDAIVACASTATRVKEEKIEPKTKAVEGDQIAGMNGSTKATVNGQPKRSKEMTAFESLGGQTLFSYWDKNLYMPRWAKWRDFEARMQATSDRVKLYVDVLSKVEEEMKRGMRSSTLEFEYISESVPGPGHDPADFVPSLRGCQCPSDCSFQTLCSCLSFGDNYANGLLVDFDKPVVECGLNCACLNGSCPNRVVQCGISLPLRVFETTSEKGFGLRCLTPIVRGQFVCNYEGEAIGKTQAKHHLASLEAGSPNFLFVLREHTSDGDVIVTCIDPTRRGNLARFLNHSCAPNLTVVPVRYTRPLARLALFANRNIAPMEELNYSYGQSSANTPNNRLKPCHCGTDNCTGVLPFDDDCF
ncbi:hypothetical protein M514_10385 [Trichuris suis]|uniref:Protein asunder n=1 Tax=Trichuris suis TaxID=68888 RepID=A0A085NEJ6_9BILA|nr:hypothetical protein M514_10385 [Trichuris suis]